MVKICCDNIQIECQMRYSIYHRCEVMSICDNGVFIVKVRAVIYTSCIRLNGADVNGLFYSTNKISKKGSKFRHSTILSK